LLSCTGLSYPVNQGHAGHTLGLKVGDEVSLVPPDRP
jgi:hypothetical protein